MRLPAFSHAAQKKATGEVAGGSGGVGLRARRAAAYMPPDMPDMALVLTGDAGSNR